MKILFKFIMQLFNVFSKKNIYIYFDPKNMKKLPSNVAHNQPSTFFFMYWPGCPNGPETEIPYNQKPLNKGLGIQSRVLNKIVFHIDHNDFSLNSFKLLSLVSFASSFLAAFSADFSQQKVDSRECGFSHPTRLKKVENNMVKALELQQILVTLKVRFYQT